MVRFTTRWTQSTGVEAKHTHTYDIGLFFYEADPAVVVVIFVVVAVLGLARSKITL